MKVQPFVGRRTELAALRSYLDQVERSGSGLLVAVRGRRQVGKSRLVEQFVEASGVPYGVAVGMKAAPVEIQMRRAAETLRSSRRPLPGLETALGAAPRDWYDLLSRLSLAIGADPAVVVLDEFPWAVETSSGLDSLLQSVWDADLSRRPVLVIMIGSDEAMLDRMFRHDQPLFGRVRHQMTVRPFNPEETGLALAGARPPVEVFDARLVTGGFPELVREAANFRSVSDFVVDALDRPHSPIADMAEIFLAGELADAASARAVLEAIGAEEIGRASFSRIAGALGGGKAAETAVTRALAVLVGKGIVAVEQPAGNTSGRLKRYRIADSHLRFWFRFVGPRLRDIEVGRADIAVSSYRRSWTAWRGKAIEPLVRESVLRLTPRLPAPFDAVESVGAWWDRAGRHEFDIVAADRAGLPVAVGSVKWREDRPFGERDLAELAQARAVIPGAATASLLAVAPRGTAPGVPADLVLDAADLLAAWTAS